MKKIAILYSGGKGFGGIERYILNLLTHVDKKDITIKVLSLGEWDLTTRLRKAGIRPVIFSASRVNPLTISKIGNYLSKNEFSLLVSQGVVSNAYARVVSLFYKIPNLVTVHSSLEDDYSNIIIRFIYQVIDFIGIFATKKYIAVSKFIKTKLKSLSISSKKIKVIYNGIDFKNPAPRQRRRLVIGSVGRLHPVKGFDILIQAFSLLENQRLRLKIAGEGGELDKLKELAKSLGLQDRVEFVGFQSDIDGFLDSIDVYVQSSRSEGFGLAVVEAMSRELPVVVTPVGSLSEIVTDQQTGLIARGIEPNALVDSINYMVSHYQESKQMGEKARNSVIERFNINTWVNKTIETYEETMK
jgi:glycosyltransferase involved in cell wall biosynthesis